MEAAALHRTGVNTLVTAAAGRLALAGGVTLARAGGMGPEWYDLKTRRRVLRILGGVARASRWALFISDDRDALEELCSQLSSYLEQAREAGWLAGGSAAEAWFLECPRQEDARALTVHVGLAPRRAREFLAFRIEHTTADTLLRELGWQPALAMAS
jgi:phage tail sheath protein FI